MIQLTQKLAENQKPTEAPVVFPKLSAPLPTISAKSLEANFAELESSVVASTKSTSPSAEYADDTIYTDPGHGNFHAAYIRSDISKSSSLHKYPTTIENEVGRSSNLDLTNFDPTKQAIYTTPGRANTTICLMDGQTPRFLQYTGSFLVVPLDIMQMIEEQRDISEDLRRDHQPCTPAMADRLVKVFKTFVELNHPGKLGVGSSKPPSQMAAELQATKTINELMATQTLKLYQSGI